MKDEGNHQGAVDKSFLEQRICIVDANYILCEKNWTRIRSRTRQAGGRQADEIQVNLEFFKNHCMYIERFDFLLCLTKVQHHYSSRNAFQVFFRVKSIVKLVVQSAKIHEAI